MPVSIPGIGLTIIDVQPGGAGVSSINSLTGATSITSPDGSINVTTSGQNIELRVSAAAGGGTVTKVSAGGLLTASTNPIVTTGDISIAPAPANTVLSNNASAMAQPSWNNTLVMGINGYANTPNSNAIQVTGSANSFYQISIQNLSSALNASSSDFVATADDGTDSTHYADFGINGSRGGSSAFTNAHAAYLYSTDAELDIGALGTSGVINFWAGGGVSTPVTAASFTASLAQFPGNITATVGRITASAATITSLFSGATASFSGKVSADAGLNTTIVSAASVNTTGDIQAATGRVTASAATITAKLTGQAASFSALVSADGGINTQAVSAASLNVTGDLLAATGRITASAGTFSGIVSAVNFVTPIVSVAYNGTTTVDASQGSYFRGVAVSAFTLSANNTYDGQKIIWEIIQDGTGSRVMTLGANFALGTDITSTTLTTAVNKRDFLGAFSNKTTGKLYVTAFVRGY